jgi:hypothetical protein
MKKNISKEIFVANNFLEKKNIIHFKDISCE